jgi:hypothetical protein
VGAGLLTEQAAAEREALQKQARVSVLQQLAGVQCDDEEEEWDGTDPEPMLLGDQLLWARAGRVVAVLVPAKSRLGGFKGLQDSAIMRLPHGELPSGFRGLVFVRLHRDLYQDPALDAKYSNKAHGD